MPALGPTRSTGSIFTVWLGAGGRRCLLVNRTMPAGVFDVGSNTDDTRLAEEEAALRAGADKARDKTSTLACVVFVVGTLGSAPAASASPKSNRASQFSLSFAVDFPSISRNSSLVGGPRRQVLSCYQLAQLSMLWHGIDTHAHVCHLPLPASLH